MDIDLTTVIFAFLLCYVIALFTFDLLAKKTKFNKYKNLDDWENENLKK